MRGESMSQAGSTLIGRATEWRAVSAFLDTALRAGGALIISGEFGAGKSAVLTAARADAEARGARVLITAGSRHRQMNDFIALGRLLEPVRDRLQVLPEQLRAALAGVLRPGPAASAGPMLVGNATLLLLRALAEEQPVLLVADDMHRMDQPSASAITFAARRLNGPRVALLGAVNTTECGEADLYGFPRQELPALPGDAIEQLLSRRFPGMASGVRDRIRAESRGNPYAAMSFAAALKEEQRRGMHPLPSVLTTVPALGDLLADRLGRLPSDTRQALLVAALNDTDDLRVLNAACPSGQASAVLEPAERAGLVSIDEDRQRLDFTHPLTRSVVVARMSDADRRRAHGALASVLSDTDPPRAAAHLAEAALGPDDAVGDALERAALIHLGNGRPRAAFAAMSRASAFTASPQLRRSRLGQATYFDALMVNVRSGSASAPTAGPGDPTAGPGDPTAGPGDPTAGPAEMMGAIAQAYRDSHRDPAAACRLFASALRDVVDPEPAIVGEAMHALVILAVYADEPGLWTEFEDLMVRYAEFVPPSVRIFAGAFGPGLADTSPQDVDAFLDSIQHEVSPAIVLRAGLTLTYLNRMGGSREPLDRCIAEGEADGGVGVTHRALSILGLDAWARGMWDEGDRIVERGTALAARTGYVGPNNPLFLVVRGLIAAARGRCEISAASAAELDVWAGERRSGLARQFADHIRCLDALATGDAETAYRFATATSEPGDLGPYRPHAAWLVLDVVESAVRSGRRGEAAAHVGALRDWPATPVSARLPFLLTGCAAMVADGAEATALFERAVTAPEAQQWPFDLARIELAYGGHLRRRRDLPGARLRLANALHRFHRLQALPWVDRAAELLRATGLGQSRPATAVTLSPMELRIATMAATGLTNNQIGSELFLSGRTVGTYLHGMFPKLGVFSRAGLADALAKRTTAVSRQLISGDRE